MKNNIILFVFFLLVFIPLCKKESPPYPSTSLRIEGFVTELKNGQPIEDATVNLREWFWDGDDDLASTKTDGDGYYFIAFEYTDYCGSSTFIVDVWKAGFDMESNWTDKDENGPHCTEELQMINFQLELF